MFIKKIKSLKGDTYLQLTKSYRDKGKVRHKPLLSLGKQGDGTIESLVQAVSRYSGAMTIEKLSENLNIEKTFILGPLIILQKLFEKLGINQALEELPKGSKTKWDIQKILFTLVAGRFVEPSSKLAVFERGQQAFYPGLVVPDIKLHQIYRALDFLALHKDNIEKSLYWHKRNLFNLQVDVVLYDLTTLRFESQRTDLGELRQFGYSKERRGDLVQVVLGLLVDKEGLPLGFEVYPGNTFEGKTVADIEKKLREKFNVGRFIFVGDRGIFSKKNLESLERGQGEFIVGMKLGAIKNRHKDFYNKSLFQEVQPGVFVYETKYEGKRLIITWSAKRAKRDQKVREEILSKIEKKLKSHSVSIQSFVTHEAYKKYVCLKKGAKKPVLNQQAIEREAIKDGFFGVITNVQNKSAKDLVSYYKDLWKVEDAFGELKGTLKARPIFHWTDKRIMGHLVMCFISYLCEAHLTKELRRRGFLFQSPATETASIAHRPLTVAQGMKALLEVRAVPVKVRGAIIWIRTEITGVSAKMFQVAKVQIPKKLLKFCPPAEEKKSN